MMLFVALVLAFLFKTEIRNIMAARKLNGRKFKCGQCGLCCGYTVVVGNFDKHHLTEKGYQLDECVSTTCGVSRLKKVDGACCFLKDNPNGDGKACSIYEDRLYICRRFPFLKYAGIKAIDTRCPQVQTMLEES